MKRACLYARVSTDRQAEEGYSLPSQLRACRGYAERHGFAVVKEIVDDISGSVPVRDRPGGREVYGMLSSVDAVIMYTADRSIRDKREYPLEFFVFLNDIQDAGAELHFVDTGRVSGSIVDIVNAWQAGNERRKILERTQRGKRAAVRAGNVLCFKMAPFGYRKAVVDGKKNLEIREDEAETVRLIFEWYTVGDGEQGPLSMWAISRRLTELRVPTCADLRNTKKGAVAKTARSYGQWEPGVTGQILKNETYAGTWWYDKRGDPISVDVPAIVSRETWDMAQERRSHNRRNSRRNTKYDYLLRTLVFCPDCGRAMSARSIPIRSGARLYYYTCYSNNAQRPCANTASYNARRVDAAAWQQISEWLMNPAKLQESLETFQRQQAALTQPLRDRLQTIAGLTQDNEARIQRVNAGYADGFYTLEEALDQKKAAQSALSELGEERKRLERMVKDKGLNDDQIGAIRQYAKMISTGMKKAEDSFRRRRELVEALETVAQLETVDGERVLHLHCALGTSDLPIVSATSRRRIRASLSQPTRGESCSSGCPG